ncbi:hypothetical protein BC834DRAFT_689334 [Gloeopeniophorella convolvens]|nr:hypothetical protein BC834DRAFT_689334 [Gloeopeniophorella convolvens]
MFALARRSLSKRALFASPAPVQTATYAKRRDLARARELERDDDGVIDQAKASADSLANITTILDNADMTTAPQSSSFAAGATFERARRGRLAQDVRFLKPTDLLPHDDPFRRRRSLVGPAAAESRRNDWFHQLGIDPLAEATNPQLLSYFVSSMGKMKNRSETKLTWRTQRRLSKAVRRAKMMGIMPILNKHIPSYFRDASAFPM